MPLCSKRHASFRHTTPRPAWCQQHLSLQLQGYRHDCSLLSAALASGKNVQLRGIEHRNLPTIGRPGKGFDPGGHGLQLLP